MRALHVIPRICLKWIGSLQRPRFECGQCERRQRCGLPPNKDCVTRAMQIARDAEMGRAYSRPQVNSGHP
jgi:hypothetical protein